MIKINASSSGILPLGHQGENLARAIAFPDAASWAADFGGGTYSLWHQRPGESTQYPAVLEMQGAVPVWVVASADTAIPSDAGQYGRAELRLVQGDVVVKSCIYSTMIAASLTGAEIDPPEPAEDWTNRVVQAAADAAKSETAAAKSAASAAESADKAQTEARAAEASAKDAAGSAQDAADTAAQVDKVVADFTAAVAAAIASVTATGEEQVAAINAAAKTAQDELAALAASGRDEVTTAANAALQAIAAAQERALSDIASARTETLNAVQAAQDGATDEITSAKTDAVSAVSAEGEAQKSAVKSAGAAQLEAVNAAGSAQKQAVEDAGKAQTKAVNDAGAAQTKAVTAAGTAAVADVGAAKDSALEEINAAIPDIPALALDDSQIDGKGWSSKHIVDMLCPAIKEVGNPIQCYPVTGYPLDIVASWEPTQEGIGDPSPDNIRKIKGKDDILVQRCAENLLKVTPFPTVTKYGITFEYVPDGGIKMYGTATRDVDSPTFPVVRLPPGKYYGSKLGSEMYANIVIFRNGANLWINTKGVFEIVHGDVTKYWYILVKNGETIKNTEKPYIVIGTTAQSVYPPYRGDTLNLQLPATIYGGEIAADGTGRQTWGYIASYAGEALPGEWISDRDVYADGTTPTIGAEVAYKLAEPILFTATGGATLPALEGVNTILTDADSVTVKARADPNHVITELQDALASITEKKES